MSHHDEAGTWGPVDDDIVGCASARLLAAGVGRRDRLQALRLLGVLDAQADATGTVRRPLGDLAGEFDLDPVAAEEWLKQLIHVGVVERDGDRLALAGREPAASGGLRLADFLATAAAVLDEREPVTTTASPTVVSLDERRRVARPLAAAGAAAAAVALVAGFLGAGGALDDERRTTPAAASGPVTSSDAGPVIDPAQPPGTTTAGASGSAQDLPNAAVGDGFGAESGSVTSPTVIAVEGACPAQTPTARVMTLTAEGGADASTGITTWTVLVTGALDNPSGEAAAVEGILVTLEVGDSLLEVLVPGLPEVADAGETHGWQVAVPVGPTPPDLGPARAELAWQWSDDDLAGSCPA